MYKWYIIIVKYIKEAQSLIFFFPPVLQQTQKCIIPQALPSDV